MAHKRRLALSIVDLGLIACLWLAPFSPGASDSEPTFASVASGAVAVAAAQLRLMCEFHVRRRMEDEDEPGLASKRKQDGQHPGIGVALFSLVLLLWHTLGVLHAGRSIALTSGRAIAVACLAGSAAMVLVNALLIAEGILVAIASRPEALTVVSYGELLQRRAGRLTDNEHSCIICLEAYDTTDEVAMLPCGHAFHAGCVQQWFLRDARCPLRCDWPGSFELRWSPPPAAPAAAADRAPSHASESIVVFAMQLPGEAASSDRPFHCVLPSQHG